MILIVGATGYLGSEICRRLVAKGTSVRALVRRTSDQVKVERLKQLGASLAIGDLKDRDSLDAACRGARTVISTASTTLSRQPDDSIQGVDQEGQLHLIDAANGAGAQHFIYVSYSGNIEVDSPLQTAKRSVEEYLKRSGMMYTILRPSIFMEIWLSPALGFDAAQGKARLYGTGDEPVSYISVGDVAQFAVESVENPAARNAVLELGGPRPVKPNDVVRTFERELRRSIEVNRVPEAVLRQQHAAATDPMEKTFAALMLGYAQGDSIDMTSTLESFPLKLRSVDDFARESARS